jgi:uncharacterized protein (TIGR02453 family)
VSARFTDETFRLLAELEANNHPAWFTEHADALRRHAFDPFERMLVDVTTQLVDSEWPLRGGRRTMSRPLRDQRYARDRPYRTSVVGLLTRTGTRPTKEGCVHVELDRDGGFVGLGFHRSPRAVLDPIRRRIVAEPDAWSDLCGGLAARGRSFTDDRSTRMPVGFAAFAGHQHAADLRLRSIELVERFAVRQWTSGEAVGRVVALARDAAPLLRFGNEAAFALTSFGGPVGGHPKEESWPPNPSSPPPTSRAFGPSSSTAR